MKPRQKRIVLVVAALVLVSVASALALKALQSNLSYFFTPTQILAGDAPQGQSIRMGGMVVKGTLVRNQGLDISFDVTDEISTIPVKYNGILPDLFREGKGAVTKGYFDKGVFVADTVLAKHDEEYVPPEMAKAMKQQHQEGLQRKLEKTAQEMGIPSSPEQRSNAPTAPIQN